MDTFFQRPDPVNAELYVVTSVFNPIRYRNRWTLYQEFSKRVLDAGAKLLTVEIAYGDREFAVTQPNNPWHLQLRTTSEIWLKENALNLGIARLPRNWKYVAWVDADVTFTRNDWVEETIQQLQHYQIVQMFSEAADLTSNYELSAQRKFLSPSKSFCYWFVNQIYRTISVSPVQYDAGVNYMYRGHHPGLAWAGRREAIDALGGLLDFAIAGNGDKIMALCLAGANLSSIVEGLSSGYKKHIFEWQERALRFIRKDIGFVPGLVLHYWHGIRAKRYQYNSDLLARTQYNPDIDLKRDWQGLYQLTGRSLVLRDGFRYYFRERNEDAPTPGY